MYAAEMIRAVTLRKEFAGFLAVDNLNFEVRKGEVLGFLGPNGAGKSTTMKMLTGFLEPSAGKVFLGDIDMATAPRAGQELLGYLPEGAPAWGDMTARQFLYFIAAVRRLADKQADMAVARVIDILELTAILDQPIDTLSKGYRRRVGLAQAILHDPPILIMDEPTDGLDPNQKHHVRRAINNMAAEKAIIISTHILEEVDALCTRAVIIDHGKIITDGTPSDLRQRSRYHGAVTLTLATADAQAAYEQLSNQYPNIEITKRGEETKFVMLVENAESGKKTLTQIDQTARVKTWDIRSIGLEQGRLEEVFRTLTRDDKEGRRG